jgi:DtxR family Mn-dependent transcriptional regulator
MHRSRALSDTHEMYLKTLYRIGTEREVARVRDLAEGLGVSPGTVTTVLKKLERRHLVSHERYGVVALTAAGNRIAECVLRRFETIRNVLIDVFGIDPETAALDACMMEHAVSPLTVHRMESFLKRPRAGGIRTRRRKSRAAIPDPCSRCDSLGVCQAEASAR